MSIRYDPTAQVYELFTKDGEWVGAYDTLAEAQYAEAQKGGDQ